MAHAFVVGDVMVGADEFAEKMALGAVGRFRHEVEVARNPRAEIRFSGGAVRAAEMLEAVRGETPAFQPIGLGKPLSIELLAVYTGDVPKQWFGLSQPDLLITSAVKALTHLDAAPRAVNQVVQSVASHRHIQPSALNEGSPIIYYTPSLVNEHLTVTLQLIADSFDKPTFQRLSSLLKTAGAVPVFVPAQAYLIAGSVAAEIFGKLGETLFESRPFLHDDINLPFNTPGMPIAVAQHIVVYDHSDRAEFEGKVTVDTVQPDGVSRARVALMHQETGEEYRGDAPYAILSLDGRSRQELKAFAPRFASAALLERFLGAQDAGGEAVETLQSAMQLYNDFLYHQKAQKLQMQLLNLDKDASDYEEQKSAMEALLKAYIGNIDQALLRANLKEDGGD